MPVGENPGFCCAMRRKFLVQIVGEDPSLPNPVDLVDFLDFDICRVDRMPVIRIRFCPFCGKAADGPVRTVEFCQCGHLRSHHSSESACSVRESGTGESGGTPCFCDKFKPME